MVRGPSFAFGGFLGSGVSSGRYSSENKMVCVCVSVCVNCSVVSDSMTPWTVTHQAPLSMVFPRDRSQSPTLGAGSFLSGPPGKMELSQSPEVPADGGTCPGSLCLCPSAKAAWTERGQHPGLLENSVPLFFPPYVFHSPSLRKSNSQTLQQHDVNSAHLKKQMSGSGNLPLASCRNSSSLPALAT